MNTGGEKSFLRLAPIAASDLISLKTVTTKNAADFRSDSTRNFTSFRVKKIGYYMKKTREMLKVNCANEQCCLQGINIRIFLHRIVPGVKKLIQYHISKKKKSWRPSGRASTSTVNPNIHENTPYVSLVGLY